MFCRKCGAKVPDGVNICPSCGNAVASPPNPQTTQPVPIPRPAVPASQPAPGAQSYGAPPPQQPRSGAQTPAGSLDIGRSFSFVFQEKDWWKKCLILGLIMLIPLIGLFVLMGYYIEVARRAAAGSDMPLPEIDFSGQLKVGFNFFIAFFVFGLAVGLVISVIYGIFILLGKIPGIGFIFAILGTLASAVLYIALYLYMFAGQPIAILEDNPWAIFQFGRILPAAKANIINCLLVFVLFMAFGLIGYAGAIACGVGVLITMPLAMMMIGNIIGQFGKILEDSGV